MAQDWLGFEETGATCWVFHACNVFKSDLPKRRVRSTLWVVKETGFAKSHFEDSHETTLVSRCDARIVNWVPRAWESKVWEPVCGSRFPAYQVM